MTRPPPIQDLPPIPDPNKPPNQYINRVGVNLRGMTIPELLDLRVEVESALPARDLKDLDLARELVLQVLALQQMQQKALQAEDTPVNQLAQSANSLSAALTNLVKLQESVYSSERLKKIEQVLIETLKTLPIETQESFFSAYELALGGGV